jgi:MOSC domain-containing protein YiiM
MAGTIVSIARRAAKRAPMEELARAAVSPKAGVASDFRGKPGKRQITILFQEDWAAAVAGLNPDAPWTIRRANLFISGLPNPQAAGGVIAIGDVRLVVTGEAQPCIRMEEQLTGLQEALKSNWRGGFTASVLTGGEVAIGDKAEWLPHPYGPR